ncbi:7TM diverse intracellular signaling domain-containing protein [Mongoliitalea daihaiensis]|uniref:7TM diverse intracellular signaling domain-containing protein n=1 Tax=Mongoliitalea daihaiensis TaxID=2782006 RepID=UPI001F2688F3|nr:7TM diverse intracellular signaling domain-containing protein [Mongoliitalea daihaiensis]UJP63405.1 receptor [Mongoliitalea daihaiensis]
MHIPKLFTICLFFLLMNLSSGILARDTKIDLSKIKQEIIISIADLSFVEDKTNSLTFDELLSNSKDSLFIENPNFKKNNFNSNYTYWVRLPIVKNNHEDKIWLVEFYDQSINSIQAYVPVGNNTFKRYQMGSALPFSERKFNHKNFHVVVPSELDGEHYFYFQIQSNQKADVRIAIRSYDRFIYYALNEYLFYGLFYGMISIIAFYNLIVLFAVRELKYVYYIFYLLSVALFTMSLDGVGYQFIWPNFPEFNNLANGVFSFSVIFWAILFALRFFNTDRRAKRFHVFLIGSLILKTVYFLLGIFISPKYFEIGYYDVIPFSLIFITGIYVWIKGYKSARLFVLAYGFLFIGAVVKFLANAAIIPHNIPIYYSLHFAFLLEMILLSFALGDRIRILKRNRDKALRNSILQYRENMVLKEKVNKELELKVKERTLELQEKNSLLETYNQQLIEYDQEIKRINAQLDRDNWKLKSSIRSSLKDRLANRLLSFDEFKTIFPDTAACNRYLENLKWSGEFKCRNCSGNKCSNGPKLFTKRCSKCGYIESVTAGTIFHGIRFPLEKAFFIAYTMIAKSDPLTLDQLAAELNLRRNTIWSFKKKISQNVSNQELKNGLEWEDLILSKIHEEKS